MTPKWTPPINGWRYELLPDPCESTPAVFGHHFDLWTDNNGLFRARHPRHDAQNPFNPPVVRAHGPLDYCCAILDAALKARK